MNPFEQMEIKKNSFTKKEKIVYELMLKNVDEISRKSVTELADHMNVSQSTITRFCQKLGYDGYNDFKFSIYRYQKQVPLDDLDPSKNAFSTYTSLILQLQTSVNNDELSNLAEDIGKADNIIILGVHKSELPARLLNINLHKLSKHATFVPFGEVQDLESYIKEDDLVIVFSVKGESLKVHLSELVKKKAAKFAMITMNDKNPLKKMFPHFIWLPSTNRETSPVYVENQVVFMIYVDILTSYIANYIIDKKDKVDTKHKA